MKKKDIQQIVEQGINYFNVKNSNDKYTKYNKNDNAKKVLLSDCINEVYLSNLSLNHFNKLNRK